MRPEAFRAQYHELADMVVENTGDREIRGVDTVYNMISEHAYLASFCQVVDLSSASVDIDAVIGNAYHFACLPVGEFSHACDLI